MSVEIVQKVSRRRSSFYEKEKMQVGVGVFGRSRRMSGILSEKKRFPPPLIGKFTDPP
jgi:hypothetical protein